MRCIRILGASALVGAMALTSCSEDSGQPGTVTLNLTVNTFEPGEVAMGVPNAEVCVFDTEDCTTTDADGVATVQLPSSAETGVTINAEGFNETLLAQTTNADFAPDQTTTLLSESVAETLAALLGIEYPVVGSGVIGLTTLFQLPESGGIPGTTYTLTEGTGAGYYITDGGFPTYDLEATSSFGGGGFVEVAPGVVEIDVGGSPGDCGPSQAWPGAAAGSIRLPVEDGSITFAFVRCTTVAVNPTVVGAAEIFGDTLPVEGAEVCQDGTENCATTNADGEATLRIEGNQEFAYAITPPSPYFPQLTPDVSDSNVQLSPNITIFSEAALETAAGILDTPWPPTTGLMGMGLWENPFPETVGLPGVSLQLVTGIGVDIYFAESQLPDPMLTETTSNGVCGIIEASEGTVEFSMSGAQNCERPYSAWPGAAANQFRFPSRVGFLTSLAVWCDAP